MVINDMIRDLYNISDEIQYSPSYTSDKINDSGWTTATTITTAGNTGGIYNIPANNTYTTSSGWTTISTYPVILQPGEEAWPIVEDALGIVFIDGNLIKLKTKNGKEVVIGKLTDDDTEIIPLEVIAAKKKLLEGSKEEGKE